MLSPAFFARFYSLDVRSNKIRDHVIVCVWLHGQQCWSHSDFKFVDKDMVLLWSHHAVRYCC